MVEHLVCNQGVVGSSPIVSTILRLPPAARFAAACRCRVVLRREDHETMPARCDDSRQAGSELFDKLGWWKEIVEDLE